MKRIHAAVEHVTGLDVDEFHRRYLYPELPVVIDDLVADWPAAQEWTVERLIERWGDYPIRAYYHPDALYTARNRMRIETTFGAVIAGTDPRVFTSSHVFPECPYLMDDIRVPAIVRPEWVEDHAVLWIQPQGQRTGLHWDSFSSLICVLRGRKRVLMFTPDHLDRLYPSHVTGSQDFARGSWSDIDVFAPDFEAFPAAREAQYREVVVEAGQALLIPRHWWHAVEQQGALNIAVSFFLAPQGMPEATFYYDRRLIAGLSIKVGVLTGRAGG